jgi:hypothetical protein
MNSLSDTCTDPARTFVTDNALLGQRSDGASTTSCCVFAAAGAPEERDVEKHNGAWRLISYN